MAYARRPDEEGSSGPPTSSRALWHLAVVLPLSVMAILAIWGITVGWIGIPGTEFPGHNWIAMAGGLLLALAAAAFVLGRVVGRR